MNENQPWPRELTSEYQSERSKNTKLILDVLRKHDALEEVKRLYSSVSANAVQHINFDDAQKEYDEAFDKVLDAMEAPEPFDEEDDD